MVGGSTCGKLVVIDKSIVNILNKESDIEEEEFEEEEEETL